MRKSNELSTQTQTTEIRPVGHTPEQIALIKRTICRGSTDDELAMFVATARRLGLDPFARQIFAVFRWDKHEERKVMTIQVSIDGHRLIADRTGRYAPGSPTTFVYEGNALQSATAYVKKLVGTQWHEVAEVAHIGEFVQDTNLWKKMPRVMLAKCAEARALRRAFPAELGQLSSPEEGDSIDGAIDVQDGQAVALAVEVGELTEALEAGDVSKPIIARLNRIPPGPERVALRSLYDEVMAT